MIYIKSIIVKKGDIILLDVDIIVNAANKTLLGGGGVDGQIHRKVGDGLLNECRKLGGCETGESKMTDAYNLSCKKIIHTVGPVYRDGKHGEDRLLESCYVSAIELAETYRKENNIAQLSIAFPCISTGVYHFPNEEAAKIVVNTLKKLNYENINVILECFLEKDYDIYNKLLNNVN